MADRPRLRVVIAEDEAIIRLDLCELLTEEGYDVVGECARGDEAVALVERTRPDVAILDVKMPGLDGLAVARRLTETRTCAVVILTAFSQRELIEEARDAGAMAYLVKPFQREDLVPAIEVAVARFADLATLAESEQRLSDQLEVRRLADRAKARLMNEYGLSEQAAFSFLQRNAMDRRTAMRAIAQQVLDGDLRP
ncbi:MAG: response regulator [Microthrixaceae bacterium]|jgi:AmiR/NasT family two-component response regulator|nr:response regulator [Actinomycetota bacterium]HMS15122.1 response regulator [Microthrixaceae bacterium]HMT23177.1 response regulator [Microthrixaceae bacterium]HMT62577.1 response regulator [Microthrixaceae bacterium]